MILKIEKAVGQSMFVTNGLRKIRNSKMLSAVWSELMKGRNHAGRDSRKVF